MNDYVPSEFYLGQNYPNPFKEKTIVKYCLPVKSRVKFSIFDSFGYTVMEVVNQIQDAGTYELEFDANHLSEGEYRYIIIANGISSGTNKIFNDTKKMILLK